MPLCFQRLAVCSKELALYTTSAVSASNHRLDAYLCSLKGLRRPEKQRKRQSGCPASPCGSETLWSTFSQGLLSLVSSFWTIAASLAPPTPQPFTTDYSGWRINLEVIAIHNLIPRSHVWEPSGVFSPPVTPLASSRSLLFQCVLALIQVSCTTGPFSPPGAWIDRKVLKWCTEAWGISKGRGVTVETCECV